MVSGREKYTYSKMQKADGRAAGRRTVASVRTPSRLSSTISPGSTSRTKRAPMDWKLHDSEEMTHASASTSSRPLRLTDTPAQRCEPVTLHVLPMYVGNR